MMKKIVPGIIHARLKTANIEKVAADTGYTVDQIQSCIDSYGPNITHGVPVSNPIKTPKVDTVKIEMLSLTHTQSEIADLLGISVRTVSRYVKDLNIKPKGGNPARPSVSELFENRTLKEISEFTGVPLDRLKIILK